jgi:hypothetical protein
MRQDGDEKGLVNEANATYFKILFQPGETEETGE